MLIVFARLSRYVKPNLVHFSSYSRAASPITMVKHAREEKDIYNGDNLKHPSTKRAKEIDAHPPLQELVELLDKQKQDQPVKNVLHWFRSKDLRQEDNKALHAASQKAKESGAMLLSMYLFTPKDMEWHGTSAARSDFILESLRIVKSQLQDKHIPLAILTAEERNQKTGTVVDFIKKHDITSVFANFEYEVDELRRDIDVVKSLQKDAQVSFEFSHDQTVVEPGIMKTGAGTPQKVFTPYHKAWLAHVAENPDLLDLVADPEANDKSKIKDFKELFDSKLPELPKTKQFKDDTTRKSIRKLWPAGNEAGMKRMRHFLEKKVDTYGEDRSEPALDPSSRMSAYFSAGIVSVRQALSAAKKANGGKNFKVEGSGIASWVREVVFRELYRQTLVGLPHESMNLPQNLKFESVKWRDDREAWEKWCEGRTGVPFVDAGMRQLNTEAYMHNRLRMITASYLRMNLLLDYRFGERYFAERLIDWDLSNNTSGWQPTNTAFNPISQGENHDKNGDYIRKWVPELKDVKGKAIFSPHDRLTKNEFEKLDYPRPHVEWAESKAEALAAYKEAFAQAKP